MTADRTVTHLEDTDFQKSRAFSPAVVTQGGKIDLCPSTLGD